MSIRVITPPSPFMVPGDIPGDHDDTLVTSLIAAVTEQFDGYSGSLGRCLAPQELEWSTWLCRSRERLPIGPVLELVSIVTEGSTGTLTTVDPMFYRDSDDHLIVSRGAAWVREPVHRVRYWAGYGKRSDEDPDAWISNVPERVKAAVRLSVQHLLNVGAENLFLSTEEVEGVGRTQYTVTDQGSKLIAATCDRMIEGLKVPRL